MNLDKLSHELNIIKPTSVISWSLSIADLEEMITLIRRQELELAEARQIPAQTGIKLQSGEMSTIYEWLLKVTATGTLEAQQAAQVLKAWYEGYDLPSKLGETGEEHEPVYWAVTFDGQRTANAFPNIEAAQVTLKKLDAAYPDDRRAIESLYTDRAVAAAVEKATKHMVPLSVDGKSVWIEGVGDVALVDSAAQHASSVPAAGQEAIGEVAAKGRFVSNVDWFAGHMPPVGTNLFTAPIPATASVADDHNFQVASHFTNWLCEKGWMITPYSEENDGPMAPSLNWQASVMAQIATAPDIERDAALVDALRNIRDYRTDVSDSIAARSMRFYAQEALAAHPANGAQAEKPVLSHGGEKPAGFDVCPISGRAFWGNIDHPRRGMVATYGGPFDTYSIPYLDEDDELRVERFDQDGGDWVDGGEPYGWFYAEQQPEYAAAAVPAAEPVAALTLAEIKEIAISAHLLIDAGYELQAEQLVSLAAKQSAAKVQP